MIPIIQIKAGYLIQTAEGIARVLVARRCQPNWWELQLLYEDGSHDLVTRHENTITILERSD